MQPHAEHQQHDADLGELAGDLEVGDIAGRGGADQHAGEQVADQRRQAEPDGDEAEDQRQPEARRDRRDERDAVRHRARSHDSGDPRATEIRR
jgi:hypothetical protein